jgi:hypothetical protein
MILFLVCSIVTLYDLNYRVPKKCPDWQTDDDLQYRKINGKSPGEAVPTPGKIPLIFRYFRKIAVLARIKACNLAVVLGAGKIDAVQYVFRNSCQPDTDID